MHREPLVYASFDDTGLMLLFEGVSRGICIRQYACCRLQLVYTEHVMYMRMFSQHCAYL